MKPETNITFAFWINLVFAGIELVGAFWTNSVAIASDAVHDLNDSFAIGLSWYLERYSKREKDAQYSFGYQRFSLLAALINCQILILGSILVIREAVPRIWDPQVVHANGMIVLAILGIAVNGFAAMKLHHGHSHNEEILSLHFLEDVLGWVAVLIVAFAMKLGDYAILDPLLSIAIALFMLWNAGKRLWATLKIFLQSIPVGLSLEQVDQMIRNHAGVLGVKNIHIWSLDGRRHVLSAHVVVAKDLDLEHAKLLKQQVKESLLKLRIIHTTLELEC